MNNIERLTKLNLEIEGLLHLLAKRESDDARLLLGDKFNEFKALMETELGSVSDSVELSVEPGCAANDAPEAAEIQSLDQVKTQEAVEPQIESENEQADAAIARGEEKEREAEQPLPEIDLISVAIEDEPESEPADVCDDEQESGDHVTIVNEVMSQHQGELRVDEMLSRREARNLRKAFTLNDKFRFRRELFGNNDALFIDTLNVLEAMKTIDEATEYLTEDLGWDRDNEDVKDFIAIIGNHFAEV